MFCVGGPSFSSLHIELKLLYSKIFIYCFFIQTDSYLDTSSGGSWYALTKPAQSIVVTARSLHSSTHLTISKGIIGVPVVWHETVKIKSARLTVVVTTHIGGDIDAGTSVAGTSIYYSVINNIENILMDIHAMSKNNSGMNIFKS